MLATPRLPFSIPMAKPSKEARCHEEYKDRSIMTKDRIRKHFENKGYKVYSCFSGVYVIHPPNGFDKVFDTLSEAHRFYFGY